MALRYLQSSYALLLAQPRQDLQTKLAIASKIAALKLCSLLRYKPVTVFPWIHSYPGSAE